jgi:hypothetical protein
MAKGTLLVQSRPASPAEADAYHRWYDGTHLPEMLAIDGVASARRLAALDGESFLAVYELDDVAAAQAGLAAAQASGAVTRPVGVQLDPPPTVQWFTEFDGT